MTMLELWHEWNSVQSFKVRVVLAEKDLAWTEHRIELLKFDHLQPQYLSLNPNGVVPTLVHDGCNQSICLSKTMILETNALTSR